MLLWSACGCERMGMGGEYLTAIWELPTWFSVKNNTVFMKFQKWVERIVKNTASDCLIIDGHRVSRLYKQSIVVVIKKWVSFWIVTLLDKLSVLHSIALWPVFPWEPFLVQLQSRRVKTRLKNTFGIIESNLWPNTTLSIKEFASPPASQPRASPSCLQQWVFHLTLQCLSNDKKPKSPRPLNRQWFFFIFF